MGRNPAGPDACRYVKRLNSSRNWYKEPLSKLRIGRTQAARTRKQTTSPAEASTNPENDAVTGSEPPGAVFRTITVRESWPHSTTRLARSQHPYEWCGSRELISPCYPIGRLHPKIRPSQIAAKVISPTASITAPSSQTLPVASFVPSAIASFQPWPFLLLFMILKTRNATFGRTTNTNTIISGFQSSASVLETGT